MRGPLVGAIVLAIFAAEPRDDSSLLQIHITRAGAQTAATCSLIHRRQDVTGTTLFFLTAGHLFKDASGVRIPEPDAIAIVGRGRAIAIQARDVLLPAGVVVDVALIRVTVADTDLQPAILTGIAPAPGEEFRIAGFDTAGARTDSIQRVRIKTSALLLGDRTVPPMQGCDGAPAISARGIFGVVISCEPGKVPVVSLLELAEPFLRRHMPGFAAPVRSAERDRQ